VFRKVQGTAREELSAIMQEADEDEDGLVSFEDFYHFLVGNCE
jgi:Ca2+-binding EF-hand superfamily protein